MDALFILPTVISGQTVYERPIVPVALPEETRAAMPMAIDVRTLPMAAQNGDTTKVAMDFTRRAEPSDNIVVGYGEIFHHNENYFSQQMMYMQENLGELIKPDLKMTSERTNEGQERHTKTKELLDKKEESTWAAEVLLDLRQHSHRLHRTRRSGTGQQRNKNRRARVATSAHVQL